MNLQEKIAKAKQQHEDAEPVPLDVEVGGELTALTFRPVWGGPWTDLVAMNPPRPGAEGDLAVGYNTDAVAADYPVDAITVDGEHVDADTWRDMVSVLSGPNRKNIGSVLYGLNHIDAMRKLIAAGKASKG